MPHPASRVSRPPTVTAMAPSPSPRTCGGAPTPTHWRLFENDVEIASGSLVPASPAAQRVEVPLEGRAAGEHRYVVEFSNPAGATRSEVLVIQVDGE